MYLSGPLCLIFIITVSMTTDGFVIETIPTEEQVRLTTLELKLQTLEQTLTQNVKDLTAKLDALNASTSIQPIAFTAVLSKTVTNLGAHQHIVFDRVLTNVGAAYSGASGRFTAPRGGVYAFFITVTNIPRHSVSLFLVKNGHTFGTQVLAHASDTDDGLYVTSSIATMVTMVSGDQVWVQNEATYSPIEELDGSWSYFSGHSISKM